MASLATAGVENPIGLPDVHLPALSQLLPSDRFSAMVAACHLDGLADPEVVVNKRSSPQNGRLLPLARGWWSMGWWERMVGLALVPNTPEVRQYRARFKDNDLPVGDWSDVISVTVQAYRPTHPAKTRRAPG